MRIVAPHDSDVFVAAPGARIAVIARGAARLDWELNGAHADAVTFTVGDAPRHNRRAGFTLRKL